ncbi:hypothetical protein [Latilactobacillus sakei]|uniref:Uncharacterized protein n=2 Tax=Latilactobacillus TaxID=2767885 RepID=A0AAE8SC76_LATSK|nr:hypothetical protein [Latilactobacillus sakei]UNC22129.1 hypothetical protein FXV74_09255 [Latilactobacillus sakei]UNC24050.1 hypothetical protein FX989_09485 [Latilactobacillus sakei]SPE23720.1 hypothetical protein LAS9267_02050 [Latilactobacillus sakei]
MKSEVTNYPVNYKKISLLAITIIYALLGIFSNSMIVLGSLSVLGLSNLGWHFMIYESTADRNPVNWISLIMEIATIIFLIVKLNFFA